MPANLSVCAIPNIDYLSRNQPSLLQGARQLRRPHYLSEKRAAFSYGESGCLTTDDATKNGVGGYRVQRVATHQRAARKLAYATAEFSQQAMDTPRMDSSMPLPPLTPSVHLVRLTN